jgi:hypothetical protein
MVVAFLRKPGNKKLKQPKQFSYLSKRDRPQCGDLFIFRLRSFGKLTLTVIYMLTSPLQACAPVAQRIEHLPCWSLNEEQFYEELIKWTAPYAGTPLEPLVLKAI